MLHFILQLAEHRQEEEEEEGTEGDTKNTAGNPPVPNCRDREEMIDRISEEEKDK
jgi:hypothetical protein